MVMLSERLADTSFAALVALDNVTNLAFNDIELADDDVIENGNVWCGTCGAPRLSVTETKDGKCVFPIVHSHELKDLRVQGKRKTCFAGEWEQLGKRAFIAQADSDTPSEHRAIVNAFCANFDKGRGLLLFGHAGRGKTFLAACICNELVEREHKCKMASVHSLVERMYHDGEMAVLHDLRQFELVVLDDFGAERTTDYTLEKLFAIVDALYKADVSMIITTNMSAAEITQPSKDYARMMERIKERCERYEITGRNRRQQQMKG